MKFGSLFTLPSLALSTAAKALRMVAAINESLAGRIAPAQPAAPARPVAPPRAAASRATAPTAQEPPAAPAGAVDIVALANRTAPQVITALDSLSTVELADLYEHESKHRRRTTVLAAIETAAAPPADARDDEDLPPDDVREPDVLVYSTASAKRSGG